MNMVLQQGAYNSPQTAYRNASVETSSPAKLIVLLYSKIVLLLRQAEKALNQKDLELSNHYLQRVQDIIAELDRTLDLEKGGEIGRNLRELYTFYYKEVVNANIKKDPAYLQPVIVFFETFRDVWMEATRLGTGAK